MTVFITALLYLGISQAPQKNYLTDPSPLAGNGMIRMVVEIPAGTSEKWEVDKSSGNLLRDTEDGKPRTVAYLPYPCNYGMLPRSRLAKSIGGDGDPLDVLLLAPTLPRGSMVTVIPIGVIYLRDRGEIDHKIIAVSAGTPLADIRELSLLETRYPGITIILATWFSNYKGADKMRHEGFGDSKAAQSLIKDSVIAFETETP